MTASLYRFAVVLAASALAAVVSAGCGLAPQKTFSMSVDRASKEDLHPLSFHFSYSDQFAREKIPKALRNRAYVTLVAKRNGRLREWVQVSYLDTKGQRRDSAAFLPILMENWKARGERIFPGYRIVQEGLTKVGELRAYQLFFTARGLPVDRGRLSARAGKGQLQGRLILLPRPGLSGGVIITMVAGRSAGFERTTQIGLKGLGGQILSSFGFG